MLSKYSVEELQSYFSDFYKDFYGSRPRFMTHEQWNSREWLEKSINSIHDAMDRMKQTFAGRQELRANGWVIDDEEDLHELELQKQQEMMSYE